MNGRAKISTIIGAVVFIATIVIYSIARPVLYPSTGLGFVFLLYSELVFFGDFIIVEYWTQKSSEIITRAGVGITIGAYALIVFLSSLIYMNSYTIFVRGFLILQILLLVAVVVITVIIGIFSRNASIKDKKVLQDDSMVRGFVDELTLIREFTDRKSDIDKLIDGIRFSDTSVMVDADVELNDAITNLKNVVKEDQMDNSEFDKVIKDIEFFTKKRNLQTRNVKQSGI